MTEEILLTIQDVSELEGKTAKGIRMAIQRGKLSAQKIEVDCRCGFEYRVSLNDLSETAKIKYYAKVNKELPPIKKEVNIAEIEERVTDLNNLSEKQRDEAFFWESIIKQWRLYLETSELSKMRATNRFISEYNMNNKDKISERTLYRKWDIYSKYGTAALADMRSNKQSNNIGIDEDVWSVFISWWLDENRPSVAFCRDMVIAYFEEERPDIQIPSVSSFYRAIEKIPKPVIRYFRYGEKEYIDKCGYYLGRLYDFASNEYWTSDYHTLDMMVKDDDTGMIFRPHLVMWTDIRSRKVLSMRLEKTSNSNGVILTFRDAVKEWGIPVNAYLDNGREFLVHDFGGRGRRKTSKAADYGIPMLERLGVKMVNAKVKNGRAKIIERQFKTFTNQFAKSYITYCGNRPENRPERHNSVLKNEKNIPLLSEIEKDLRNYIEGYYNNKTSKAEGLNGISPNECYDKHLIKKKTASSDQLDLLLLRSSRLKKFDRGGIYLDIKGTKVYFYNADMADKLIGNRFYIRYDSDKLDTVRLYDEEDRFVCTAERAVMGGYAGNIDEDGIKYLNSVNKALLNRVKAYKDVENCKNIPKIQDVLRAKATRMSVEKDGYEYSAKVLEIMPNAEKSPLARVSGEGSIVNLERMIENAKAKANKHR